MAQSIATSVQKLQTALTNDINSLKTQDVNVASNTKHSDIYNYILNVEHTFDLTVTLGHTFGSDSRVTKIEFTLTGSKTGFSQTLTSTGSPPRSATFKNLKPDNYSVTAKIYQNNTLLGTYKPNQVYTGGTTRTWAVEPLMLLYIFTANVTRATFNNSASLSQFANRNDKYIVEIRYDLSPVTLRYTSYADDNTIRKFSFTPSVPGLYVVYVDPFSDNYVHYHIPNMGGFGALHGFSNT